MNTTSLSSATKAYLIDLASGNATPLFVDPSGNTFDVEIDTFNQSTAIVIDPNGDSSF